MVRLSILYIPFVWGETEGKQTASHSPLYSQRTPPQSWTQSPLAAFHAGPIYYELEQWSYGFLSFLAHFQRKYLYRFADKPLETASVQLALKCNEPPPQLPPLPPPPCPSLPLYRLTHVELSDCTVLSLIINTQDHQCSHLWAVSFGAIAIMVMFSENCSAERNELWRTAMMCCYLTQRLQSDLSRTSLMNGTRPLLSVLLYCFP